LAWSAAICSFDAAKKEQMAVIAEETSFVAIEAIERQTAAFDQDEAAG